MRSANLNIIIKSLEKSTMHVARDFSELENLQSNPASAAKFADACARKIKKLLIDDLTKIRPQYNIFFFRWRIGNSRARRGIFFFN